MKIKLRILWSVARPFPQDFRIRLARRLTVSRVAVVVALQLFCVAARSADLIGEICLPGGKLYAAEDPKYTSVSLISLIATPEKFAGKFVVVEGIAYFASRNSVNAIFLTRDDKRAGNGQNGVYLIFASNLSQQDKLNDQYVLVRGRFQPDEKGHLSSFSGSLVEVDLVRPMKMNVK